MTDKAPQKPTRVTKPQPTEINEGTPVERLNGSQIGTKQKGSPPKPDRKSDDAGPLQKDEWPMTPDSAD